MPSIMAGINQTIMLSLSMVVIASIIGADGIGNTVLPASSGSHFNRALEAITPRFFTTDNVIVVLPTLTCSSARVARPDGSVVVFEETGLGGKNSHVHFRDRCAGCGRSANGPN